MPDRIGEMPEHIRHPSAKINRYFTRVRRR